MNIFRTIRDWFKGSAGTAGPIKHVVVLMFENHSFDQMLGCFKSIFPTLDGVDTGNPRSNKDLTGREYFQNASSDPIVDPDPKHELKHVLNQLDNGNSGFVSEYQSEYPDTTPQQRQRIMDYFRLDDLPALHMLAKNFTICDRWFSSVPGPTWTNRFFVHTGTSKGIVDMPTSIEDTKLYLHYDQDTIFDRLNEKDVSWRVYFGDVPNSLVLRHQQRPKNALHYRLMHNFFADAQGREADFPAYSFIEPNYLKGEQNDDHPPHSSIRAQQLLGEVYNALRSNEDLWNAMLLIVLYDEHGGFYDHVEPPGAVAPDQYQDNCKFNRLGVRVPALLISPWVDQQVLSTEFDHTSLLKYMTDKWNLGPLTERVKAAESFAAAIRASPRPDTPKVVPIAPMPVQAMSPTVTDEVLSAPLNENQKALAAFSEHLQTQTITPVTAGKVAMGAGPSSGADIARERVNAFLNQQKAIAVATAGQA